VIPGGTRSKAAAYFRRLPVQLVALLSLALFPLGVIALYQTGEVIEEARQVNRAVLMERTVAAGALERELIQRAAGASQALGVSLVRMPVDDCNATLDRFVDSDPSFLSARLHDADGRQLCRSRLGAAPAAAGTGTPLPVPDTDSGISIEPASDEYGIPVVRVTQRIGDDDSPGGFVSLSIPLRVANALISGGAENPSRDLRLAVVGSGGRILAQSHEATDTAEHLPRNIRTETLFELQGTTFEAVATNGDTRVFAVSSIIDDEAALVGSWPLQAALADTWTLEALVPLLYPIVMWLVGVTAAYVGLQRLVIRHITVLRSGMRRLALGELRGGRIELDNPPEELRETERAFNRMVLLLAQAEAQQEQDLRDKEVLLKEVHHRVKNNLQLIGSIMNMQARNARTPEARRMLDSLRIRVRGLATMHRSLYSSPEMTTVPAGDMIETLVNDLASVAGQRDLDVQLRLEPVELYPDQAVPLSMLVAETVTNAVKYAGRNADGETFIRVGLGIDDTALVLLRVENSVPPAAAGSDPDREPAGDGLGTRLIAAFEQQLRGQSTISQTDRTYLFELRFQRRDFEADAADPTA
jgi:two-component sensor histidine kinase